MRRLQIVAVLILGAVSAPGYAASIAPLEAYTGILAGFNTCDGGGGPPTAITSFFSDLTDFGVPAVTNGSVQCGLSGGITDLTQSIGPLNNVANLANAPFTNSPGTLYNGSARATANYGSVSVATQGSINGTTRYNGLAESVAFGIASDTLNVGEAPTSGYMAFQFTLNGSYTVENSENGGAGEVQVNAQTISSGVTTNENIFYATVGGTSASVTGIEPVASLGGELEPGEPVPGCVTTTGSSTVSTSFTCTDASLETYEMPVTFSDGAVTFSMGLLADTFLDESQTLTADPPGLTLTGIEVFDATGNPISDFTITSGSGAVYGPDGIESEPSGSPEPTTFLLAGGALLALGCARRKRRP